MYICVLLVLSDNRQGVEEQGCLDILRATILSFPTHMSRANTSPSDSIQALENKRIWL